MQINNLKELKPGDELVMVSNRFNNAKNRVIFVSHDRTKLNREIGYFKFADGIGEEFAIWQHEIALGRTSFFRS